MMQVQDSMHLSIVLLQENGIFCVSACAGCHGDSCMNVDGGTSCVSDDNNSETESSELLAMDVDEMIYLFDETDCQDEEVVCNITE